MLPDLRDAANLWDMLQYARDAAEFASRITLDELRQDRFARYTLSKPLQEVGEAARRLSEAFRSSHPEIEWKAIIGFRNRIVHEYGMLNVEVVWQIVQRDVPELIRRVEGWLPPLPGTAGNDIDEG